MQANMQDKQQGSNMKLILHFAKGHKWMFLILFVCIVFSGALYPYIFGRLVDEVFYGKNMDVFFQIVVMYAIIYFFNQVMHFVLNMSWARLMTKFLFDIREAVLEKGLSLKGETLSGGYSGDLLTRMNKNVEEFMNLIHWNIFYVVGSTLNLICSIFIIWYLNTWIAVFVLVLTPLIVYLSRFFSQKEKKYKKKIEENNGLLTAWIFEIIRGMQDIRLLGAVSCILSDYTKKTVQIMRWNIQSDRVQVVSERVNSGVATIARLMLYGISAWFVINGGLTVGEFTACVAYFGTCINVFNALNNRVMGIAGNMVGIDRVREVFEKESENYGGEIQNQVIERGDIGFHDVYFDYGNDTRVLKGITLQIQAGECIALVGKSGAGKSTIANLIYKLYSIRSGNITFDGINQMDFNLHNLRDQIGMVHQDSIFFDGTIRYNLLLTQENKTDEELWNALKMAHLYDFVSKLPKGLDTKIGYEGIQFSGGQKQRLAIARIFVKNPKILIFDEATSALDSEAEQIIMQSWDKLRENRTILVIAHRLSTILNSDKVAVLHEGVIAGYDHHLQLLQNCSVYRELFKEQYSVGEVEANA